MKQPKKLTREQKAWARSQGLNPKEWMVSLEMETKLVLVNKRTEQMKAIDKKEIRR